MILCCQAFCWTMGNLSRYLPKNQDGNLPLTHIWCLMNWFMNVVSSSIFIVNLSMIPNHSGTFEILHLLVQNRMIVSFESLLARCIKALSAVFRFWSRIGSIHEILVGTLSTRQVAGCDTCGHLPIVIWFHTLFESGMILCLWDHCRLFVWHLL